MVRHDPVLDPALDYRCHRCRQTLLHPEHRGRPSWTQRLREWLR